MADQGVGEGQGQGETLLCEMVRYIVDIVKYRFPAVTAHALRRAVRGIAVPRPALDFDSVAREQGGEADEAFTAFALEACARHPEKHLRSFLLAAAARSWVPMCRVLLEAYPEAVGRVDLCAAAAENGHHGCLLWARSLGFGWGSSSFMAARGGHGWLVRWLHDQDAGSLGNVVNGAAHSGSMDILRWAVANGGDFGEMAASSAAGSGHVGVLEWAAAEGVCQMTPRVLSNVVWSACAKGHLSVLEWAVVRRGASLKAPHFLAACDRGRVGVLEWMRARGFRGSGDVYGAAAEGEDAGAAVAVVKWLLDAGYPRAPAAGTRTTLAAVKNKNVGLMRLLLANRFPACARSCCKEAASRADLPMLELLRESGLLLQEDAGDIWRAAISPGGERVVEWLGGAGGLRMPGPASECGWMMGEAADAGSLEILRFLHARGCPPDEDMFVTAVRRSGPGALEFLRSDVGCAFDEDAVFLAAENSNLEAAEWLQANGCPMDDETARNVASRNEERGWRLADGARTERVLPLAAGQHQ